MWIKPEINVTTADEAAMILIKIVNTANDIVINPRVSSILDNSRDASKNVTPIIITILE